nr:MAG TPA_asm: hypothetical protein [Caudoviricetes sp.]
MFRLERQGFAYLRYSRSACRMSSFRLHCSASIRAAIFSASGPGM